MPVRLRRARPSVRTRRSISTRLSTVDAFLASIADTPILALDTEGASFHRFVDRIYLLQLSTRDETAIIDPLPIGTPAGLGALLEDPVGRNRVSRRRLRSAAAAAGLRLARPQHLRHARRRAAARAHGVRPRRAARAVLRREARQEASARRLVDAPAHRRACSTTRRRTRSICSSCGTS